MKLSPLVPEHLFVLAPCRFISFKKNEETIETYLHEFDGKDIFYHPIQSDTSNNVVWEKVEISPIQFVERQSIQGETFYLIEED